MLKEFGLEIKTNYVNLTKTERKVADFVLNHSKEVLLLSITELAERCHVGDTTVYRFCRSIGLKGYQEFKMRLSLSLTEDVLEENEDGDSGEEMYKQTQASKILERYKSSLTETLMLLDESAIIRVVKKIEKANCVYVFGMGNSGVSALDARNRFARITHKVQCINEPHFQAMMANIMSEEDLIIVISYSGDTQETIDVARIAKNAGAQVACISRYENATLANYVDDFLLCGASENPAVDGSNSISVRLSQMYLIDIIYQTYYRRNIEIARIATNRTQKAVMQKLY